MKRSHAFSYVLLAFISTTLTACGGGSSGSSSNSSGTAHPQFVRAKVAVSSFYQPSGIIHDRSPEFTWKATVNATSYHFGFEDTESEENWQDYIVAPVEANCVSGDKCSYTPNDIHLSDGDEKVWWVQSKVAGEWKEWSKAYVFKYVDDSSVQTDASPISPIGVIDTLNPTFKWTLASGADTYQFGFETADESDWKSYEVLANQANCQAGECSFTPVDPQLQHNDVKTWWVRSLKNGIWSNWSNGSQFSIDLPSSSERPLILKVDSLPNISGGIASIKTTTSSQRYNYDVDCDSDGIKEATQVTGSYSCIYSSIGEYRITISGLFPRIRIERVTEIEQWGSQIWSSMAYSFLLAKNLKISASDSPDLSQVTSIEGMFARSSFDPNDNNQNLSLWDVSNITNMRNSFRETQNFNQDISNWDVSHVTDMSIMFFAAKNINSNIENWDVSNVTSMNGMFMSSTYNQNIGNWNTSSVRDMRSMFNDARDFNQPIESWDVSNVNNMELMFSGALSFNQPIGNWDVSKVTNMGLFLSFANSFSTQHYDELLVAWSTLPLKSNVKFSAGNIKYSASSSAARQTIIDDFQWDLRDGGQL